MNMSVLPVDIRTMRYVVSPTIDFYYPVVRGMANRIAEEAINRQIIGLMYHLIARFNQPGMTTYITGSYEIKANERNVLSLLLWALGDFGGAHPMTYAGSLNFDVTTGVNQTLKAQFKPDSDYVGRLSDIIRRQIQERNIPLLGEFEGIRPDQEYYIADNVLVVYFQLYEISPYVAGFPYFPIPLFMIQDMLAEEGLLQRMDYFL